MDSNDFAYVGITTEIEVHINWSIIDMIHLVLKKRKIETQTEVAFWAVTVLQPPVSTN